MYLQPSYFKLVNLMAKLMSYLIGIEKPLSSQLKGRDDVSQRRLSDVLFKAKMYPPAGPVRWHRRKTRQILPTSSLVRCWHKHPPIRRLLLQGDSLTSVKYNHRRHPPIFPTSMLHTKKQTHEWSCIASTIILKLLLCHCDHVQSNNLWLMAGTAKYGSISISGRFMIPWQLDGELS